MKQILKRQGPSKGSFYYNYCGRLGLIYIVEDDKYITYIGLQKPTEGIKKETALIKLVVKELEEYFEGQRKVFDFPIKLLGTNFQKKVWTCLLNIPYGQLVSYKSIAIKIGRQNAYRAVALACHNNKLLFVVPCHRVVGTHNWGGYILGLNNKLLLINLEKTSI